MIVKRLLTFSRPYRVTENNINTIIYSSLEFIEHRFEPCNIRIHREINESLPPVLIDVDYISMVFINIMMNALESMLNGGILAVKADTCRRHDGCVTVCISDTGSGIRSEIMDKIFEPFFSTKDKEGEKGLGMGLADNVQDIVR